jgi:hypothetical protein
MPRQKSLITVIRELVQDEVRQAMAGLLGSLASKKPAKKWPPASPPPRASAGFKEQTSARLVAASERMRC